MEYYAYTYKSDKAFVRRIFSCIITLDVQIKCTIFNPLSAETKLALLPIRSSDFLLLQKKRKISFFSPSIERILITNSRHARRSRTILRYETSWTRARHHSNTRRKIESQVSRLHRNTRVIFMDGWPAPVPSRIFQKLADPRDPARRYAHNGAGATAYRFIVVAQFALARRRPSERESSVFLFFSFLSLFLFSLPSLPPRTRLE